MKDIKEIKLITEQDIWTYQTENEYILKPTKNIEAWQLEKNKLSYMHHVLTKFIKINFNMVTQTPEINLNSENPPTIEYAPKHGYFFFVPFNDDSIFTLEWIKYEPNIYWGVINSNHPISEIIASTSYKPDEDLSEKEKFCQSITHLLDNHMFYDIYKNNEKPSSFMRYIAHLYIYLIDAKENLENIIPFKVFFKNMGIIEVNDELIRRWI